MSNTKFAAYTTLGAIFGLCASIVLDTPEYLTNTPPIDINEDTARYTFNAVSALGGAFVGTIVYALQESRSFMNNTP